MEFVSFNMYVRTRLCHHCSKIDTVRPNSNVHAVSRIRKGRKRFLSLGYPTSGRLFFFWTVCGEHLSGYGADGFNKFGEEDGETNNGEEHRVLVLDLSQYTKLGLFAIPVQ